MNGSGWGEDRGGGGRREGEGGDEEGRDGGFATGLCRWVGHVPNNGDASGRNKATRGTRALVLGESVRHLVWWG